jgi:hypothetical protein
MKRGIIRAITEPLLTFIRSRTTGCSSESKPLLLCRKTVCQYRCVMKSLVIWNPSFLSALILMQEAPQIIPKQLNEPP